MNGQRSEERRTKGTHYDEEGENEEEGKKADG